MGTESLATLRDGQLVVGAATKGKPALFLYDIAAKQVVDVAQLNTIFKSIEGLCVPNGLIP